MQKITLYHNPRCSKSRQALQILEEHRKDPEIVEYLKTPLTEKELTELLKLLKVSPRELLRKNEETYRSLNLSDPTIKDKELIAIIAKHPILMERPIVVVNHKAIIARPPEKILELI